MTRDGEWALLSLRVRNFLVTEEICNVETQLQCFVLLFFFFFPVSEDISVITDKKAPNARVRAVQPQKVRSGSNTVELHS